MDVINPQGTDLITSSFADYIHGFAVITCQSCGLDKKTDKRLPVCFFGGDVQARTADLLRVKQAL